MRPRLSTRLPAFGAVAVAAALLLSACPADDDGGAPLTTAAVGTRQGSGGTTGESGAGESDAGESSGTSSDDSGSETTDSETTGSDTTGSETTGSETTGGETTGSSADAVDLPTTLAEIVALADAADAQTVVARTDDEIVVWSEGAISQIPTSADTWVWSDGSFVYQRSFDGDALTVSTAHRLDGSVVCELDEPIEWVRSRPDRTYVAAVENSAAVADWDGIGTFEVPIDAVDCLSGDRQPIDPVFQFSGEFETIYTENRAGRTFRFFGDVEGNANVLNEDDLPINGPDYAGYHTFNGAASVVVYGVMNVSPHHTSTVRARDTVTADLLWERELDEPFSLLSPFASTGGDRLLIGYAEDFDSLLAGGPVARVTVHDLSSGEVLLDLPTTLDIIAAY